MILQCEYHPKRIAVGRCHKCGKRFCVECAEETGQTRLCRRCLAESTGGKTNPATAPEMPQAAPAPQVKEGGEAFLAQGPDYDFSDLKREERKAAFSRPAAPEPAPATPATPATPQESLAPEPPPPAGMDLDDVLASLVDTSATVPATRARGGYAAAEEAGDITLAKTGKERLKEIKEQKQREKQARSAERVERWDFLSQPRSNETTFVALTKPRAVLFIMAMWLLAASLWAVPNAYLVPKDSEWVIHAILVGVTISICFWWKAGKKHSTKLAVQATLVTIFGLLAGEFLHSFLIIMKQPAFRTIFMDVVSFKFVWENGGELLSAVVEDMFPVSYLLILIPPAVVAFIVGYGMPPIPEVFFELGRAVRGKPKAGKEHA